MEVGLYWTYVRAKWVRMSETRDKQKVPHEFRQALRVGTVHPQGEIPFMLTAIDRFFTSSIELLRLRLHAAFQAPLKWPSPFHQLQGRVVGGIKGLPLTSSLQACMSICISVYKVGHYLLHRDSASPILFVLLLLPSHHLDYSRTSRFRCQ